ncbi:MAG: response regulator [Acidobacteria bacterium]|nr:response regulator [Acidobacteriota bacterium]MCA1608030.1 response regulator [Acidobacteriota bacterium]
MTNKLTVKNPFLLKEASPLKRILHIDDHVDSRELVSVMLGGAHGCIVESIASAKDIARFDDRPPFDLYIVDLWLPGVSGTDLIRRLRSAGITKPIVAFSGAAHDEVRAEAFAVGANVFLAKPNGIERIFDVARSLLSSDGDSGLSGGRPIRNNVT